MGHRGIELERTADMKSFIVADFIEKGGEFTIPYQGPMGGIYKFTKGNFTLVINYNFDDIEDVWKCDHPPLDIDLTRPDIKDVLEVLRVGAGWVEIMNRFNHIQMIADVDGSFVETLWYRCPPCDDMFAMRYNEVQEAKGLITCHRCGVDVFRTQISFEPKDSQLVYLQVVDARASKK